VAPPNTFRLRLRWAATPAVVLIVGVSLFLAWPKGSPRASSTLSYAQLFDDARLGKVRTMSVYTSTGVLSGRLKSGLPYSVQGPIPPNVQQVATVQNRDHVTVEFFGPLPETIVP
jgi:hypothetical protein